MQVSAASLERPPGWAPNAQPGRDRAEQQRRGHPARVTAETAPNLAAKVGSRLWERTESSLFVQVLILFVLSADPKSNIKKKIIRKSIANGLHTQNLRISMFSLLELGIRKKNWLEHGKKKKIKENNP